MLEHNGKPSRYQGYCTDIFTDAAIRLIEDTHNRPFFVYLPTNAPHSAFTRDAITVGESYVKPYLDLGMEKRRAETYGMLTNLDENLGRLLGRLQDLGLDRNTIVIFTTDKWTQDAGRHAAAVSRHGGPTRQEELDLRGRNPGAVSDPLAGGHRRGTETGPDSGPHRRAAYAA